MEECPGEALALQERMSSGFLNDMAALQAKLAGIKFSQFGSIYYKEDVDPELQARPLYAEGTPEDESSHRFRIGPSVDRRFYRGGRAYLNIDRGPCAFFHDFPSSFDSTDFVFLRA